MNERQNQTSKGFYSVNTQESDYLFVDTGLLSYGGFV